MAISTAAMVALGVYVVSRAMGKHLRDNWRADGTVESVARAAMVGVLELIRSLSGSAVVALSCVYLLLSLVKSVPVSAALGGIQFAQLLHGLGTALQGWIGGALFLVALAALYFVSIKPTRQAITEAYEAARQRELARLKAAFEAGDWPEQEPNADMRELGGVFGRIHTELEGLKAAPNAERERQLTDLLEHCRSAWFSMDVQRRMKPDYALASTTFERSGSERAYSLLALLLSRSTREHLGSAQRLVGRAASFLLVLSLVGWASVVADANATLLDLRSAQLVASKEEAVASIKGAKAAAQTPDPPPTEAEIDNLARQFDHAFVRGFAQQLRVYVPEGTGSSTAAENVERLRNRRRILDAATGNDAKRNVTVAEGIDLTRLESEALDHIDDASVGRRFVNDLRRHGLINSAEFWQRIRNDRFAPVTLRDASETIMSEVVGEVLKGPLPTPDDASELSRLARSIERTAAKKAVMRAYTDAVNGFISDVGHGTKPSEILQSFTQAVRVNVTDSERVAAARVMSEAPTSSGIEAKLAQREPALAHTESMADDALRNYSERIRALPEADRVRGVEAVRRIGSTYDDFFPRQATAVDTSGSRVAEALANALGNVRPPTYSYSAPSRMSAAVRSARLVRGLRFVGGVVIGDTPSDDRKIDAGDLSWRREGGQLQLTLSTAGGTNALGSFDARIVRQALAYAADGRTVAVTMTSIGATARGLKVLAHPALVDTRLGNDVIEVDRLVDTYGRRDNKTPTPEELFLETQLLAARVLCREEDADEARKELLQLAPRVTPLLRRLSEPGWSFFAARSEYFSPEVSGAVNRCATNGLVACIAPVVGQPTCAGRESWSGVREKAYPASDVAVPFAAVDADTRFQFLIQVVFVEPPAAQSSSSGDDGEYIDPNPWEYPAAQPAISSRVIARMNSGQRAALRSTWQFTYLQRVFRNAIDGRLGPRIAARLVALARDTARDVDIEQTPRWSQQPVAAQLRYAH